MDQALIGQQVAAINFLRAKYPGTPGVFRGEVRRFREVLTEGRAAKAIVDAKQGFDNPRLWEDVMKAGYGSLASSAGMAAAGVPPPMALAAAIGAMFKPLGDELGRQAFREFVALQHGKAIDSLEAGIAVWRDRPLMMNKELSKAFLTSVGDPGFRQVYNDQIATPAGLPIVGESEQFYMADNPSLFAGIDVQPGRTLDAALADERVQKRLSALIKQSLAPTADELKQQRDRRQAQLTEQTLYAGANLLESALSLSDKPTEARVFRTVFSGAMELKKNFADFQDAMKELDKLRKAGQAIDQAKATANLAGAVMTFNMISLGLAVVSAFSQQKSESAVILEQLGMIAQQIDNLRKEMHQRFDGIDAKLDNLLDVVSRGFSELKYAQAWTLQKVDDLGRRVVDDSKRRASDPSKTDLFAMLTREGMNTSMFAEYSPSAITTKEAQSRSAYLHQIGQTSTEPVYHSYSGGTLANVYDYVLGEYFLAALDPFAPNSGPITRYIDDRLGMMFDAYEATPDASAGLSNIRVPNFRLWGWASQAFADLYAARPDRISLDAQARQIRDQGARFENLATVLLQATPRASSPVEALLDRYQQALAGRLLPELKRTVREAALQGIMENSSSINPAAIITGNEARIDLYCDAGTPVAAGFSTGDGNVLAKTRSYPLASPPVLATQYDFLALNSLLKQPSERLCFYTHFVEQGEEPIAEKGGKLPEAYPAGSVARAKKVVRQSGIAGSFAAVRKTPRLRLKTAVVGGIDLLHGATNVTRYTVPMNTSGRNTLEYFYQSENTEGHDWTTFGQYLRKISQFVPMSNAQMSFDTAGMQRTDQLLTYLGAEFRQHVFAKISERVTADLTNPTSKLAEAAAETGFYKHALRIALHFAAGPEMEKQEWLWLRFNGPESLIDSQRLYEMFSSAEMMTATLLGNLRVEVRRDKELPYECKPLDERQKTIDADCASVIEFQRWVSETNRLHQDKYRRPGQALYAHLALTARADFFDPAEIIFADQLGFPKMKTVNSRPARDAMGYTVPDGVEGGWVKELRTHIRNLRAESVGTIAPIRRQLIGLDQIRAQ